MMMCGGNGSKLPFRWSFFHFFPSSFSFIIFHFRFAATIWNCVAQITDKIFHFFLFSNGHMWKGIWIGYAFYLGSHSLSGTAAPITMMWLLPLSPLHSILFIEFSFMIVDDGVIISYFSSILFIFPKYSNHLFAGANTFLCTHSNEHESVQHFSIYFKVIDFTWITIENRARKKTNDFAYEQMICK